MRELRVEEAWKNFNGKAPYQKSSPYKEFNLMNKMLRQMGEEILPVFACK